MHGEICKNGNRKEKKKRLTENTKNKQKYETTLGRAAPVILTLFNLTIHEFMNFFSCIYHTIQHTLSIWPTICLLHQFHASSTLLVNQLLPLSLLKHIPSNESPLMCVLPHSPTTKAFLPLKQEHDQLERKREKKKNQ